MKHYLTYTTQNETLNSSIRRPYKRPVLFAFKIITYLLAGLLGSLSLSAEPARHSYLSCAVISSEHLTTLQLYQRGLSLEVAQDSLPDLSKEAKKRVKYIYKLADANGLLNTYSDINTNFARCATLVHDEHGVPAKDKIDYGYYFCSGENKTRFEIMLHINKYHTLEAVLERTPDTHHDIAIRYFRLINNKGLLAAFDYTANNLKACLGNLK